MKNEEFIKSFVRLKPILMDEMPAITSTDHDVIINKTKQIFSFNEVFNDSDQNDRIYYRAISPLMSDLLNGYSACVLAYGQTSSGKTYTMKGVSHSLGLIPLSIKQIFNRINQNGLFAKVTISYFEIYNENIIDLLSEDQLHFLDLREDGKKNLIVVDLIEQEVKDEFETLSYYQKGELKRKFASNNINFASSRSHTIFKITLSTVTEQRALIESSIYMVDLAGSESISKTNAVGVLKKQAENINKSLLALTTAIRAISERQNYVNYRNSKLTRILQPCLSGSSKTVVICTVKQSQDCIAETINTLKFGLSANAIRIEARQNFIEPVSEQESSRYRSLIEILDQQRSERAKLQLQLVNRSGQAEAWKLRFQGSQAELEECKHKLFALENQNRHHSDLIQYFRSEQEKEKANKNIFFEKSQESIALIENQNRNLKVTIHNLNEAAEKRNKKLSSLERNERFLLDKIEKYEKDLASLQKMISEEQPEIKGTNHKIIDKKKKNETLNFHEMARSKPPENGKVTSPMTIGTVIELSTTILAMKIDMNHYLTTITELHSEISQLEARLDDAKKPEETNLRSEGNRRQSGVRSKEDQKRSRNLQVKNQQLKQQNEKLKKKIAHYLKILKKCANNNIKSIAGFNDYLDKNFKYSQKELFEELMQQNAEDYEPYVVNQPNRDGQDKGTSIIQRGKENING